MVTHTGADNDIASLIKSVGDRHGAEAAQSLQEVAANASAEGRKLLATNIFKMMVTSHRIERPQNGLPPLPAATFSAEAIGKITADEERAAHVLTLLPALVAFDDPLQGVNKFADMDINDLSTMAARYQGAAMAAQTRSFAAKAGGAPSGGWTRGE